MNALSLKSRQPNVFRHKLGEAPAELKPYEKKVEHGTSEKYEKQTVDFCPEYMLFDNPTAEQEASALTAAELECQAEINTQTKSVHEQIAEYRQKHGIKNSPPTRGDVFDQLVSECAAKVRRHYPGAYDDLDDSTLMKKVLAKYPKYCDANSGDPPGWQPVIEGVR